MTTIIHYYGTVIHLFEDTKTRPGIIVFVECKVANDNSIYP